MNSGGIRVGVAIGVLLLSMAPTDATQSNDRVPPATVRNHVAGMLTSDGRRRAVPPGLFRKVDVTRDGVADWLVDYGKADPTRWCGTGGCHVELFVSRRGGPHMIAFDEAARTVRVTPAGRVDVDVYGTYCGSFGADDCRRSFVWSPRDEMLMPVMATGQQSWLFGPLFSPVVSDQAHRPAAVAAALSRRAAECLAAGASLDEADGAVVRSPDLDGDGRADWILGSPYSACVPVLPASADPQPDLPRPTLVVLSGAADRQTPLYVGTDANYVVDISTRPATLMIVPDEESRLRRCADRPRRCGGTALHWDPASRRLTGTAAPR